jgi:alkylation response protein AidB-like acyl-CoA dehydrogenase
VDFSLTDEQKALRDQIVRFARAELSPGARERDAAQVFPRELWLKCGAMGLQGLPVPQAFGGAELSSLSTAVALDALGYGCEDGGLVFAVCAHLLACVVPIWLFGSEEQKAGLLPDLCAGRRIAVNAMTETESGSDAFNLRTRARPEGDGFVIQGTKVFGSNGPVADVALVYAATDPAKGFLGGVTAFLIDAAAPGYNRGQSFEKMGLRTCPIGETVLDDVRVRPEAVLGRVGSGGPIFARSMEWERVCIAAAHCGHMERLIETCLDYAKTRKSAGRSIGSFQAISHRIADMKVRLESARLVTYRAAWQLERKSSIGLEASVAKLCVSEALVQTARDAMQIFGGSGYMVDLGIERSMRDALAATIYSGTNEMQRNIVANWLGLS